MWVQGCHRVAIDYFDLYGGMGAFTMLEPPCSFGCWTFDSAATTMSESIHVDTCNLFSVRSFIC